MRFTLHPLWTSGYFNPPAQTYFPDQFGYYLFSHIDFTQLFPISTTYNYPPPPPPLTYIPTSPPCLTNTNHFPFPLCLYNHLAQLTIIYTIYPTLPLSMRVPTVTPISKNVILKNKLMNSSTWD